MLTATTSPSAAPSSTAAAIPIAGRGMEIEGLGVRFGGLDALQDISLTIAPGRIMGLIGPNGAGKTTFVNCLTGFQRTSRGRIRLDGVDASGWSPDRFRRAGVSRSFQSVRLFGNLTVLENVEVAGVALGLSRCVAQAEALQLLDWLGIRQLANRPVAGLPYVAERHVGMARALMGRPGYLLLDEPAAGMSEAECEDLLVLLRAIPAEFGCALLLIEHNMDLVMQACERLHVLDGGRSIAEGTPDEVMRDPQVIHAYLGDEG